MATSRFGAANEQIQILVSRAPHRGAERQATTTIVTFLVVFIIQNTQNRETEAMQIKLDELIRATQGAHVALLDLEELDEEQLERYRRRYAALAAMARDKLRRGELDTDSPDIKPLKSG